MIQGYDNWICKYNECENSGKVAKGHTNTFLESATTSSIVVPGHQAVKVYKRYRGKLYEYCHVYGCD